MLRIASSTRSRSFGRTIAVSLITCDTVPIETWARSAICRIVTSAVMACRVEARASCSSQRYRPLPTRSLLVYYATEPDYPGAVHAGAVLPTTTITGTAPGTSTLTVSTSSSTPGGSYTVTGSDAKDSAPSNGPQALALTTASVIQHVVVIFQENRTPDNLFQDPVLYNPPRSADIAQSGVNSLNCSNPQDYDLSHANAAFVSMYNGRLMNGANLIPCSPAANCPPNAQFMYVKPADVQVVVPFRLHSSRSLSEKHCNLS